MYKVGVGVVGLPNSNQLHSRGRRNSTSVGGGGAKVAAIIANLGNSRLIHSIMEILVFAVMKLGSMF